ncbi:nuclear transport factor 2 family protein [Streptosporangium lutulentum]|uniref:Ketosteroid isomerase-like protein n=1 Tax=Streptosporangium lutulentum TaxID=1461250 RepID=A0ABT9QJE5_9ACTN|nr:nuclear transport factor 2 family protein [Streptosporangium lutulentum]MDP9846832.1 ketosteroid isomerase-like protein [Streptosporangium lutulentum]
MSHINQPIARHDAALDETDPVAGEKTRTKNGASIDPVATAEGVTREIVGELLRRIGEGDHDKVAELFAERIDWQLNWPAEGHPAVPWIRPRSGRADIGQHFRLLDAHHVPELNGTSVTRILVDGDHAVVLGHIAQTVKAGGRSYSSAFALHLTVEDGLITRYHIYEDSLSVAEALKG